MPVSPAGGTPVSASSETQVETQVPAAPKAAPSPAPAAAKGEASSDENQTDVAVVAKASRPSFTSVAVQTDASGGLRDAAQQWTAQDHHEEDVLEDVIDDAPRAEVRMSSRVRRAGQDGQDHLATSKQATALGQQDGQDRLDRPDVLDGGGAQEDRPCCSTARGAAESPMRVTADSPVDISMDSPGDWLGRDSSSLSALPPPGGSQGEGLGRLGLLVKEAVASGPSGVAASVILAPSYRNERTISTFGLASPSALAVRVDGEVSAGEVSVTAQSDGALVKKAPALPNLRASPCVSAPASIVTANEATTDLPATDETATDVPVTDEAATAVAATHETATDEVTTDETATDEAAAAVPESRDSVPAIEEVTAIPARENVVVVIPAAHEAVAAIPSCSDYTPSPQDGGELKVQTPLEHSVTAAR